jgi:formate-dependent nitrite reductase cytochrome c552 subunit
MSNKLAGSGVVHIGPAAWLKLVAVAGSMPNVRRYKEHAEKKPNHLFITTYTSLGLNDTSLTKRILPSPKAGLAAIRWSCRSTAVAWLIEKTGHKDSIAVR